MPTSRLYISLDAIIANYLSLDALSGRLCATGAAVKADAYGLGMTAIAPALHEAGSVSYTHLTLPTKRIV